jgi:uracil phosphoribosyltransferase
MRTYTAFASSQAPILENLRILASHETNQVEYQTAFQKLGASLGQIVADELKSGESIALAASSEDADWLMTGILNVLKDFQPRLAVLWNLRSNPFGNEEFAIAPVVKEYVEDISKCDTLIVCKSIIHTSCVVRTNLIHLIERTNPKSIYILSPVLFKGAEERLRQEFPEEISEKFQFLYFAVDEDLSADGNVLPGIGGNVYERLGIGNVANKNKYIPEIVVKRRAMQPI